MSTEAKNVSPEIVAVISAAIQAMMGGKVVAVKIKNSTAWAMAARGGRR